MNTTNKNGVKNSIKPKNKLYVVPAGGDPPYSGKKKMDKENTGV